MIKKTTKILTSILVFSLLIFFNSVKIEAVENPEFEVYFMVNDKREFTKDNLDLLVDPEYNEVALELYIRAIGEERTLTTLQLELVENNLLKSITFTESATVGRNNIWDMSSSSGGNAPSGPILALMGLGGQDVLIQTTPTYMATIYFEYNNLGDSDLLIDFNFTDAGRDGGFKTLDKSCFIINPIIVGDPNSTPDASLSSLDITGNKTNQTYDFNVDAEEIEGIIKNQITISYQDSINGLTINPIFNKSSLGSSNYTIEESRLDGNNYYNGDTIKIVTTDGDDSKTYMIEVFVEEPAIETGINLSLQAGDSGTISFNNDLKRYEIVTPFIETDIKVLASTIDPNATLNQTELSFIGLKQEEWTKLGVFIVTAEDGTTYEEYPVFAMRQKGSSNANIKIETNEFPNGIEPEGNNFIFNYDENKQSISFRIIKEHIAQSIRVSEDGSNYTNYTEGLITKNQIQTGTTYSYEILVTPESGFEDEIVKYKVDFIIAKSSDTSLKTGSIKVKEDGFDEIVIDNNNLLYIISDNDSKHVTISIETDRNRQIKFGDGLYQDIQATHQIDVASLNYGNNNIYFTIKAEDGTTEEYYINIKKLSDQAEIESLVFRTDDGQIIANKDNFNYISSENKYVYRFDYGVYSNPSTLKLDVTTSQFSTISGRNSNNAVYTLDFSGVSELTRTQNIDIIAENGTTKNFTIQIVRNEADSNNEVVEINIGGIPFSQFKSGDIDVVYDKVIIDPLDTSDTLNFEIRIPTTSKATVKIGDRTFNRNETGRYNTGIGFTIGKEQVVKIVVTAQNGQTNTLTIPFIVATNNTKLSNIELLGTNFVFDPNVLESTINVNYSFGENITINAKAEHSSSKVFIDSVERETYSKVLGTNKTTVRVWVLSQAGIKGEEYVITINRNPALTNNDLDSFILKSRKGEIIDIGFLSSQTSYSIRIDDNDELWPITYSASLDPAHNSYLNNNKNLKTLTDVEFNSNSGVTGQIIVDVYSEGGIKKTYTINVLKANDIKDFESVTISGIGFTTQTFTKDQSINNVLDLGSISYNVSQLNVSFNMISGSNSTIEASFIKNATSGIWDLNQTGSNEEQFRVKSQAGNYSEYFTIKVNREVAKSENKLKELEVEVNGENILSDFNPKTNRYDLRVDRNISEVNILATLAKDDRSKVNSSFNLINEDTLNKYYSHTLVLRNHIDYASTEFKLEVEAEDGSINTYYITIWRRNVEIGIEEIQILNGSLVIYEGTVDNVPYLGEFDYSVNNLTIIITPKDKYTRISLLGKTAQTANEYGVVILNPELTVGDNIITIRVQSDLKELEYSKDAVSQIIELEYRKNAASNVAELESLEVIVNGINLLKDIFSSDKLSYSGDYLRVDRTFENVRINAKAKNNGLVTASNLGTKFLNAGQTNIFIITVESESKQNSTEYKVEIVSKNDVNKINDILVNNESINFIEGEYVYTLSDVEYDVNTLPLNVLLEDQYASYYVNGNLNAKTLNLSSYGNNSFEIYGVSEYGTESELLYTINIYRKEPYINTGIDSLIITDIDTNEEINYVKNGSNYTIELPSASNISNVKIDVFLLNEDKQKINSTIDLSNITLSYTGDGTLYQEISFEILAEDNNKQTYTVLFTKDIILSGNSNLENVIIKDRDNNIVLFSINDLLNNNEVTIDLAYKYDLLNIEIISEHEGANVSPNKVNSINLNVGENIFDFSIRSQDGINTNNYIITINRDVASTNNKLKEISIVDTINNENYLLGLDDKDALLTFDSNNNIYVFNLGLEYLNLNYRNLYVGYEKMEDVQTVDKENLSTFTLSRGENIFVLTTRAEDKNIKPYTYTIVINVKNTENSLDSLFVNNEEITIDSNDLTYVTENKKVDIKAIPEFDDGYILVKDELNNIINSEYSLVDDIDNNFVIEVYNEFGDMVEEYNLTINRIPSSNIDFNDIKIIDNLNINHLNNFDFNIYEYNIEVSSEVEYVILSANIHEDATATNLGRHNVKLDETIEILFKVTAEDGTESAEYIFNITKRSLSNNNKLNNISIKDPKDSSILLLGDSIYKPLNIFDKNKETYTINLDQSYSGELLVIEFEKGDIYQNVNINTPYPLELGFGLNRVSIIVTPEDSKNTEVFRYIIEINVLNLENSLKDLKINNNSIKDISNTTLVYETESKNVNIIGIPKFDDGRVVILDNNNNEINSTNLIDGTNDFKVIVYNVLDEKVEEYTLLINRIPYSDSSFNATLMGNDNIDYLNLDGNIIYVPSEVYEVRLEIFTNNEFATTIGEGIYQLEAGKIIEIPFTVTAENGIDIKTYVLEVFRNYNSENRLQSLEIETNMQTLYESFGNVDINNLTYQLNEEHQYVIFTHQPNYGQTVELLDASLSDLEFNEEIILNNGLNKFIINITPEEPNENIYTIEIEITVLNSNVSLKELLVDGIDKLDLKDENNVIKLPAVDSLTNEITVKPILEENTFATYKINNIDVEELTLKLKPGLNKANVVITSQDGSNTVTYIVEVEQLLEAENTLELLEIINNNNDVLLGESGNSIDLIFDPLTNEYHLVVNEDTDSIRINYNKATPKQKVLGPVNEDIIINHGINDPIVILVTAENGDSFEYIVNVLKQYNEIYIDEILIDGVNEYVEDIYTYELGSVLYEKNSLEVNPVLLNYTTYVIYDNDNNIVLDNNVNLEVGLNKFTVELKSENEENSQIITFNIERLESSNADILDVLLIDVVTSDNRIYFDPEIKTYSVSFPHTTENVRLDIKSHELTTIFIDNIKNTNKTKTYKLDENQATTIEFYAVAADGTVGETYKVNVFKRSKEDTSLSNDTTLTNITLEVPINQIDIGFRPDKFMYEVVIPYKYEEVYVKGHTRHNGANIPNEGAYYIAEEGNTTVRFRVVAEDGTVANQEYVVKIRREKPNNDTTLNDLIIKDMDNNILELNQPFNKDIRSYSIKLDKDSSINLVYVDAILNDSETQKLYSPYEVLLDADLNGRYNTLITVTVEAENGEIGTYQVYVLHDLDFDDVIGVKDISLIGDDDISYFGLEFMNNQYEYTVDHIPYYVESTRLIIQTVGNGIVEFYDENGDVLLENTIPFGKDNDRIVYRFKIISGNSNRSSKMYEIEVIKLKADSNTYLSTIEVNGVEIKGFNKDIYEYDYIHPLQFESYVEVKGLAESDKSIVRGNNVYELFEGQVRRVELTVIAEDGSTTTYFVNVKYVSSNALLGGLTIDQIIGEVEYEQTVIPLDENELYYSFIISRETDSIRINAAAKDLGGASVTGSGKYTFSTDLMERTFEIIVTSGDGTESLTYYITIIRDNSLSSLKEIASLIINDQVVKKNGDDYIYEYKLSNGSDTVKLNAIANSNAKISINDEAFESNIGEIVLTNINESQVVRISVQAEDGTVENFMVVINKEAEPSMLLTILLILSIILWVITAMILIFRKNRNINKKNKDQVIF